MPSPLLLTKLGIPPGRSHRVERTRLIDRMNAGLDNRFLLLSAPAGYGKTTLVLEWLSQMSGDYAVAWFSLDEGDNDPTRFLTYIIAALQQVQPGFGESVQSLLQSPQQPQSEIILTMLINEMAAVSKPFILVIDDYHTIHTPGIHQDLTYILDHQPDNAHIVVTTREDPLLPISRLRARGHLLELRQDDLRFTTAETTDFLQNVMSLSLSENEVAALERRTEGWVAGLQLAALSMQGRQDLANFIQAFTGSSRFILDYLIEEVFEQQTSDIKDFLLKTSILGRLSGDLCDYVTERTDSQDLLEKLEQANLFIVPLDQSRGWYRYHRLFAELLNHRLRTTQPEAVKDLHTRASQWFEQNDFISDAVQHALAAQNWDSVAQILAQVSTQMLNQGETTTLVRWYGGIPRDVLLANPRLCFDYCWPLLLTGHYEEARELLTHVEKIAQSMPVFLGEIMTAQAYLARSQGDLALMVERSQRARALLPKESVASRGLVAINLGLAYWHMGQMEATEEVLQEALEASRLSGNYYGVITAVIFQGRVLAVRGQLREAEKLSRQAIEQGGQLLINSLAYLDMSALHYEWNQLAESDRYLQGAFDLCGHGQDEEFDVACLMMLACLRLAQGNLQGVESAIARGQAILDKGAIPLGTASRFEIAKLRLALAQGDLASANNLEGCLDEGTDTHNFNRFTNLTKAKLLLARGQREQAAPYLAELARKAQQNGWGYALISIRAWQALTAETRATAVQFLQEALQLAQPEGLLRTFIDLGEDLVPYLQDAFRLGIEPAYTGQILAAFEHEDQFEIPQQTNAESLSERELEVLRLIVAGLSNREIAQNLVISLGTAKTHIHNIYGKLDVSNRAQAIARAREIELI